MTEFRLATSADIEVAADTLSKAFEDYAWTRWTVAPDDYLHRVKRIQAICLCDVALPYGMVIVNDDLAAVLALSSLDAHDRVDPHVWQRICEAMGELSAAGIELDLPRPVVADSWELSTVGVAPDFQGKGLGSKIIGYALDTLDVSIGSTAPVRLETSDPRNVRLYQRHGFRLYAETTPPQGPRVWSLQRGHSPGDTAP